MRKTFIRLFRPFCESLGLDYNVEQQARYNCRTRIGFELFAADFLSFVCAQESGCEHVTQEQVEDFLRSEDCPDLPPFDGEEHFPRLSNKGNKSPPVEEASYSTAVVNNGEGLQPFSSSDSVTYDDDFAELPDADDTDWASEFRHVSLNDVESGVDAPPDDTADNTYDDFIIETDDGDKINLIELVRAEFESVLRYLIAQLRTAITHKLYAQPTPGEDDYYTVAILLRYQQLAHDTILDAVTYLFGVDQFNKGDLFLYDLHTPITTEHLLLTTFYFRSQTPLTVESVYNPETIVSYLYDEFATRRDQSSSPYWTYILQDARNSEQTAITESVDDKTE